MMHLAISLRAVKRASTTAMRKTIEQFTKRNQEGRRHEQNRPAEQDNVEGCGARGRTRPCHAFLSGSSRADERRRHRARPLRGAARDDEEWPHARPEWPLYATRAGHSPEFR